MPPYLPTGIKTLKEVYRRLRIGQDDHLGQTEAYNISESGSWIPELLTKLQSTGFGVTRRWTRACSVFKWNESGFRPLLCTYSLNWVRRTSWGWWDDWDDTVLQTQDSKFKPWRSEAEHATSRSQRLPTILSFTSGWGRNIFVSFKLPKPGKEPRTQAWKAAVLTTSLGPPPWSVARQLPSINPALDRCLWWLGSLTWY